MPLLDGMISTGRFAEFVNSVVKTHNDEVSAHEEEMKMKYQWEHWLFRVHDMSFKDYLDLVNQEKETAAPTQFDLQETFNTSFQMLEGFSLRGGAQEDGTIQTAGDNSG